MSESTPSPPGNIEKPFWETKSLTDMTPTEWESLCDGCGKCCLLRLEDEDTGDIYVTDVACRLLDCESCRCKDYDNRFEKVADCVQITPDNAGALKWMPSTCAYRLLAEGKPLPWWHPLISGDADTVHEAAVSVRYRVLEEDDVAIEDLPGRIVNWPL